MNQDEIRMKTVINKIIAYQDEMGMGFKRRIGFYKMSKDWFVQNVVTDYRVKILIKA